MAKVGTTIVDNNKINCTPQLLATLTLASYPPRPRCSSLCCPPACSICTSFCRAPPSQASLPRSCSSLCSREQMRGANSLSSLCRSCRNSCRSTLCSRHTSFRLEKTMSYCPENQILLSVSHSPAPGWPGQVLACSSPTSGPATTTHLTTAAGAAAPADGESIMCHPRKPANLNIFDVFIN